jgi:hypothetical protein
MFNILARNAYDLALVGIKLMVGGGAKSTAGGFYRTFVILKECSSPMTRLKTLFEKLKKIR